MAQHIFSGSGAPTSAPSGVGHHYIDTTADLSYISVGTTSSADWIQTGGQTDAITLLVEVYNQTGSTLLAGEVVYINGSQGNLPTVAKAQADTDLTSARTLGLIRNDISNNGTGFVVASGLITNLDTSAIVAGTAIYLSATTAGAYTTTPPTSPDHSVYLGVVVRSNPSQGSIEVKVQNGQELEELHDVLITSLVNGQTIKWDSATSVWKNVTLASTDLSDFTTAARTAAVVNSLAGSQTDQAPSVSATNSALSGKEPTLTKGNLTETTSSVLTITGGTNAVIGSGVTIEVDQADASNDGYLSSSDWITFNTKVTDVIGVSPIYDNTLMGSKYISISPSGSTMDGYLTSNDWNTFNNKWPTPTGTALNEYGVIYTGGAWRYSPTNRTDKVLVLVKNNTAINFIKGQAVYVTGSALAFNPATNANEYVPTIDLANAGSLSTSHDFIGLLSENINSGSSGYVICQGILEQIQTSGPVSNGDQLFLSTQSSPLSGGYLTNTLPAAPNTRIFVCEVTNAGTLSDVYVYVQRSIHLDRLNNVEITAPTNNGQVLTYNSTNLRWQNEDLPANVSSLAKSGSTALTGAVTLSAGTNVTLTQTGNDIEIASSGGSSGVTSFSKLGSSGITGAVTISEGSNVTLTQVGQDIQISASGGGGGGASAPDFLLFNAGII